MTATATNGAAGEYEAVNRGPMTAPNRERS
jgi:hypothetical protein